MICIKRVFETPEQAMKVKTQYHEALRGSPACEKQVLGKLCLR